MHNEAMLLALPTTFLLDGKKYKVVRQIGEGAFGFVYHVREALLVLDRGKTSSSSSVSLSPSRDSSKDSREGCKDCALKKMICQTAEQAADAEREIRVMSSLSLAAHPHILPLWAHAERRNRQGQREFLLLMPLMAGSVQGEIDRFLRSQAHAQEPLLPALRDGRRVLRVLRQTLSALQAMHKQDFRHGDLKPANLLFAPSPATLAAASGSLPTPLSLPNPLSLLSLKGSKEKGKEKKTKTSETVMLTDFGSVSPLVERVSSRSEALVIQERAASHTTASYRAPELFDTPSECVLQGESDIWSFGCLWYMLCFNRTPFESEREGLSVLALLAGRLSLTPAEEQLWPADWIALLRRCLSVEREKRPTADELAQALETLSPPPRDLSVRLREIEEEKEKNKLQEAGKEKKKEQGISLSLNPLVTSDNSNSHGNTQTNKTEPLFVADFSVFNEKLNDNVIQSSPRNDDNEIVMEISVPDKYTAEKSDDEGEEDEDEFGEFTAA